MPLGSSSSKNMNSSNCQKQIFLFIYFFLIAICNIPISVNFGRVFGLSLSRDVLVISVVAFWIHGYPSEPHVKLLSAFQACGNEFLAVFLVGTWYELWNPPHKIKGARHRPLTVIGWRIVSTRCVIRVSKWYNSAVEPGGRPAPSFNPILFFIGLKICNCFRLL